MEVKREAVLLLRPNSSGKLIKITFPYNLADVGRVRTLEGRRYDPDNKQWTAPLSIDNVKSLQEWKFDIDPKLTEYLDTINIDIDDLPQDEVIGLNNQLYPFQQQGVAFIEARRGRALIADEMGLGKTVQALSWLHMHPELRPALIVCPASLKLNWEREAHRWLPDPKTEILSGGTPYKTSGDILIINYDILAKWVNHFQDMCPAVLIMDEIHLAKNSKAKRTKAVKVLGRVIPHVIGLSGTPIVNRPVEAFNAINLIEPSIAPSFWEYAKRYCNAKHTRFGWDFTGASNTDELHQKLVSTIMLRRLKADVLKDLPDKIRSFIPIELSNKTEYKSAEQDFIAFIRQKKGAEAAKKVSNAAALAEIEGLKQLSVAGKMDACISWIQNFLNIDGKLVVFASHKFVINRLMEEFGDVAVKVDGSVTGANRQKAVDDFQTNDAVRLFVGNIKAAGVGLTLTAASNVAFMELGWSPGEHDQAEDRCHRITQENSVNIYYLLAVGTIEEKIAKLLDKKRKIVEAVLDGTITEEESLLTELMKEYENENNV